MSCCSKFCSGYSNELRNDRENAKSDLTFTSKYLIIEIPLSDKGLNSIFKIKADLKQMSIPEVVSDQIHFSDSPVRY